MVSQSSPRQGELYWLDIDNSGPHPVVIAAVDALNRGSVVLVVPFTSQAIERRRSLATCAFFDAGSYSTLDKPCVAQAEMIRPVPIHYLDRLAACLSTNDLNRVLTAIANVFVIPTYMDIDESNA